MDSTAIAALLDSGSSSFMNFMGLLGRFASLAIPAIFFVCVLATIMIRMNVIRRSNGGSWPTAFGLDVVAPWLSHEQEPASASLAPRKIPNWIGGGLAIIAAPAGYVIFAALAIVASILPVTGGLLTVLYISGASIEMPAVLAPLALVPMPAAADVTLQGVLITLGIPILLMVVDRHFGWRIAPAAKLLSRSLAQSTVRFLEWIGGGTIVVCQYLYARLAWNASNFNLGALIREIPLSAFAAPLSRTTPAPVIVTRQPVLPIVPTDPALADLIPAPRAEVPPAVNLAMTPLAAQVEVPDLPRGRHAFRSLTASTDKVEPVAVPRRLLLPASPEPVPA